MKDEKPNGAKAGWKLLRSETRFENKVFRLREDEVQLPNGERVQYAYIERAPAVIVIPITPEGEMVMVRQYRHTVDEWCLEVPAGGTHDHPDASLEENARRELREEVGGTAAALREIGSFYPGNAFTDERCHVFLATGVQLAKEPETEQSEAIEPELVPIQRALQLARTGAVATGPSALAILMCEPHLRAMTR
jgi:ADP-ribose pyrophosphatase